MFYRRKVVLAIVQSFGGQLEKIKLQKLLFLFANKQDIPVYSFIPYRFGCYSLSAQADIKTMLAKSLLEETESSYLMKDAIDYRSQLKEADKQLLRTICNLYGDMDSTALMRYTYVHYPYYAIYSELATELLTEEQLQRVSDAKPKLEETILYTIGYEGIALEDYLNRLIKNSVQVLVDVRRNPLSMKFGFSKSLLLKYCNLLGIAYVHIPEVGIASDLRQDLKSQADYDQLFERYRREVLTSTSESQQKIVSLLIENKRIALTCFEKDICQCHRTQLAQAICALPNVNYKLKHI